MSDTQTQILHAISRKSIVWDEVINYDDCTAFKVSRYKWITVNSDCVVFEKAPTGKDGYQVMYYTDFNNLQIIESIEIFAHGVN